MPRPTAATPLSGTLAITGHADADALVNADPIALLLAMLLDQQIPLEWAFAGPHRLLERLGHLDPGTIAAIDLDTLVDVVSVKPALHRFPRATAKRIHDLMAYIDTELDGEPSRLWSEANDGSELRANLQRLPGFGPEKTQITIAVLGKRFGIAPTGWEQAAGVFADDQPRTAADISDAESLAAVRAWKAAQKRAGLDKQGRRLKGS